MDAKTTALLVIDMQNDFVDEGAVFEVRNIRKDLGKLGAFIGECRKSSVLVVYTRHCYTPEGNPVEAKLFPEYGGNALRKGTHGWEINEAVAPEKGDLVMDKTRYDAFFNTDLDAKLKTLNIKTVIVTGTMTEVCCASTASGAMFRDYEVVFCSDLNFTSERNRHKMVLKIIKGNYGEVMDAETILGKIH